MNDFDDLIVHFDLSTIDDMMKNLNEDQLRIFGNIKSIIEGHISVGGSGDAEILQLFVSGCGGTGKSYLIETIRAWVQGTTAKDVVVAPPTGIASLNINGLTIHGILVLPVEHGSTPSYQPMSDNVLKIVLCNALFIVDEVSSFKSLPNLHHCNKRAMCSFHGPLNAHIYVSA